MKRILFACDGNHFSNGAFEFVRSMQLHEPISLTGIFFSQVDYEQLIEVSYIPLSEPYVKMQEAEKRAREEGIDLFSHNCEHTHIKYQIHDEGEGWDKEKLTRETRFADLLIISEELFCANVEKNQPNMFMKEILHAAECPVLIVPENYIEPQRVVFAYDGRKDSMYALKQFCYLFPQFAELSTEIIYAKDEESKEIPDQHLLSEFARHHFNYLNASKLHFDGRKFFTTWIEDKKDVILITGSFGRSPLSTALRSSFVEDVIRHHHLPVFIAHHI